MSKVPHIMIAEARFYDDIADFLLDGAKAALDQAGARYEVFTVPGALELPAAIKFGHESGRFDGFIALGCVLRGETYHFEVVSNESARGLMNLALKYDLALANGILTCETQQQALERADPKQKNKGGAFAQTALEMIALKKDLAGENS